MISIFDLFKIGIGPSSSHTVGPMKAARQFAAALALAPAAGSVQRLRVTLFGSLAATGIGHGTLDAIILGLAGHEPERIDPEAIPVLLDDVARSGLLPLAGVCPVSFDRRRDIVLDLATQPPRHPNTLMFEAFGPARAPILCQRWCSVGGGFVIREDLEDGAVAAHSVPLPFANAAELLALSTRHDLSIAEIMRRNETALRGDPALVAGLSDIAATMFACIDRGLRTEGDLPGGLKVRRRAPGIYRRIASPETNQPLAAHVIMDIISVFAIAVNEENAAGGRVVTAPTNGAAGVIPAVLRYFRDFCPHADERGIQDFLLTAAAIGALCKLNASISGAEVGCQGEVGSASAMAAAGLCAALGGTPRQIENAAEIAMEHHLGMTCDPIGGLVQVPCIERNAFGAIKAVNAASLALRGDGTHLVSLDTVIRTMRQTGLDMHHRYKETSQGGLAVAFVEC